MTSRGEPRLPGVPIASGMTRSADQRGLSREARERVQAKVAEVARARSRALAESFSYVIGGAR